MPSGQESLNKINPQGYPRSPELTDADKAENRRWVAQKRAENAAKKVTHETSKSPVITYPKPSVAEQPSVPHNKPTQYRVFTADGWKPIYQGYSAPHNG